MSNKIGASSDNISIFLQKEECIESLANKKTETRRFSDDVIALFDASAVEHHLYA